MFVSMVYNIRPDMCKHFGYRGFAFSTFAPRGWRVGGGGSNLPYISIAYYMQKGGGWVQIACKSAYVLNGRPHTV